MKNKTTFLTLLKYLALCGIPIAFVLEHFHGDPMWIFISCAIAIVPLAGLMGEATEVLATFLGAGIGGLLNATFGNAAELIIAFFALKAGLHGVVKATITGSIIGNILLVLGLAIFAGGLKHPVQKFNITAAGIGTTMLALSTIGLILPAVFHHSVDSTKAVIEHELTLSIAIILFTTYILGLVFQLKTHKFLYEGELEELEVTEPHHPHWSKQKAMFILFLSTVFIALLSEMLVGAIEVTAKHFAMTEIFMGVILLAIIGNAAEHSTAVLMAMKNKMDLAMTIAVGSSQQVALFVAPVLVFASFILGNPMDLTFTVFEILAIIMAVTSAILVSIDGRSNWLEGVMLLAVYAILGVTFFFLPAPHPESKKITHQTAIEHVQKQVPTVQTNQPAR